MNRAFDTWVNDQDPDTDTSFEAYVEAVIGDE